MESEESPVYKREELIIDSTAELESTCLRVMHWNVLADVLAHGFPKVKSEHLQKDFRVGLMIEEIKACAIDIQGELTLPHLI